MVGLACALLLAVLDEDGEPLRIGQEGLGVPQAASLRQAQALRAGAINSGLLGQAFAAVRRGLPNEIHARSGDHRQPGSASTSAGRHLVFLLHATAVVRPIYEQALERRVGGVELHFVNSPFGVFASGYRHLMAHLQAKYRTDYLDALAQHVGAGPLASYDTITVASFSAGYAGVRAMLEEPESAELIDAVVGIDSWHTEFDGDGTARDSQLSALARFAVLATTEARVCWLRHTDVAVPRRGPREFASTSQVAAELRRLTELPAAGDDVSRGGLRISAVDLHRDHHLEHSVALWGWGGDWLADAVAALVERRRSVR